MNDGTRHERCQDWIIVRRKIGKDQRAAPSLRMSYGGQQTIPYSTCIYQNWYT